MKHQSEVERIVQAYLSVSIFFHPRGEDYDFLPRHDEDCVYNILIGGTPTVWGILSVNDLTVTI